MNDKNFPYINTYICCIKIYLYKYLYTVMELKYLSTLYPEILSAVFTVTEGGAWQTVLQHGEGRPEDPQQRGRGGDGMSFSFYFRANVRICVLTY